MKKNRLSTSEIEQVYQEEIKNLQEKIQELNQQIFLYSDNDFDPDEDSLASDSLIKLIGPEIYVGEISDRLRFSAKTTLSYSEQIGLDKRTEVILKRITNILPVSSALSELLQDISRATKDSKHLVKEVATLLSRHGYQKKSDNKHVKFEPIKGFDGLGNIIVSKTPSENRGLKNMKSTIEKTLGLSKLCD
ncbi:hypothetical protein [Komagataeibacter europaeus]|uniref:hypothetical protein n=1 Tax=Komagataeibacter europaeus TaxID=33995 RepID=UPI00128F7657|nr:hypothetical protein [Komagataeibacter europaeus]